jgi:homoserine dehydrogenase
VRDAFNAVQIVGNSVGPVFFQGLGAGQLPTASAVVGDLIDTILGRTAITFNTLNLWSGGNPAIPIKNPQEFFGKWYLRLNVVDRLGVMHEISGILGMQDISIAAMVQHEPEQREDDRHTVLFLTTHEVREGNLLTAIRRLEESPVVLGSIVRIRVQS